MTHQGALKGVEERATYLAADNVDLEVVVESLHPLWVSCHIAQVDLHPMKVFVVIVIDDIRVGVIVNIVGFADLFDLEYL